MLSKIREEKVRHGDGHETLNPPNSKLTDLHVLIQLIHTDLNSPQVITTDQRSGIHCPIVWGIQLSTPSNLGGTWRRICSLDTQGDSVT